jgi:hypothetical protein
MEQVAQMVEMFAFFGAVFVFCVWQLWSLKRDTLARHKVVAEAEARGEEPPPVLPGWMSGRRSARG